MTHDSESQKKLARLLSQAKKITKKIYTFLKKKKSQGDLFEIDESTDYSLTDDQISSQNPTEKDTLLDTLYSVLENEIVDSSQKSNQIENRIEILDRVKLNKNCNKNKALKGSVCVVEEFYIDPRTYLPKDFYLLHPIEIDDDESDFLAEEHDFDVLPY